MGDAHVEGEDAIVESSVDEAARDVELDAVLEEAVSDRRITKVLHYPGRTLYHIKFQFHGQTDVEVCVLASGGAEALATAQEHLHMELGAEMPAEITIVSVNATILIP